MLQMAHQHFPLSPPFQKSLASRITLPSQTVATSIAIFLRPVSYAGGNEGAYAQARETRQIALCPGPHFAIRGIAIVINADRVAFVVCNGSEWVCFSLDEG